MSWKPIETAPKDGTLVLLLCPKGVERRVYTDCPDTADTVALGWWGATNNSYNPKPQWVTVDVLTETYQGSELTGSWDVSEQSVVEPTHWLEIPANPQ